MSKYVKTPEYSQTILENGLVAYTPNDPPSAIVINDTDEIRIFQDAGDGTKI